MEGMQNMSGTPALSTTLVSDAPEFACTVHDESLGLIGYVVIDASIAGHACGGLRMSETVNISELKNLARSMTLKYGFNQMAQGGAKAGIVADRDMPVDERRRLLKRFGELIAPLLQTGYYNSGPDMSVTAADIEHMLSGARMRVPAPRKGMGKRSGLYTAMGVMTAAEAATSMMETTLQGKTVAIEGFGAVGSALAMLLTRKKNAKVVAISTSRGAIYNPAGLDIDRLLSLRESHGDSMVSVFENADRIDNEELLVLDVDILSPCARQFAVAAGNAAHIRARLLCPGANNPVAPGMEEILSDRNIMSIPDFVANGGGVLGNKIEVLGMGPDFIESFIRQRNFERIRSLIQQARETGATMAAIAERKAANAFTAMRQKAEQPDLGSFMGRAGLRLFNVGLIPAFITRPLAPLYLKRTMSLSLD
jgi:glutamate dehydrogenase (NAD(P)+)